MADSLWPHGLYSLWNSPGQNTGASSLSLLQVFFATQGSNPGLWHCRWILYHLSHQGSPRILEWVVHPFSSRSSWPKNQTESPVLQADSFPAELSRKALVELLLQNYIFFLSTLWHFSKLYQLNSGIYTPWHGLSESSWAICWSPSPPPTFYRLLRYMCMAFCSYCGKEAFGPIHNHLLKLTKIGLRG